MKHTVLKYTALSTHSKYVYTNMYKVRLAMQQSKYKVCKYAHHTTDKVRYQI